MNSHATMLWHNPGGTVLWRAVVRQNIFATVEASELCYVMRTACDSEVTLGRGRAH